MLIDTRPEYAPCCSCQIDHQLSKPPLHFDFSMRIQLLLQSEPGHSRGTIRKANPRCLQQVDVVARRCLPTDTHLQFVATHRIRCSFSALRPSWHNCCSACSSCCCCRLSPPALLPLLLLLLLELLVGSYA